MRADTVASSNVKNRIGSKGPSEKVADVRLLLEEKRQGSTGKHQPPSSVKSGNVANWIQLFFLGFPIAGAESVRILVWLRESALDGHKVLHK